MEDALCTFALSAAGDSRAVALRGDAARRCDELREPEPNPLMEVPLSGPDTGKPEGCALACSPTPTLGTDAALSTKSFGSLNGAPFAEMWNSYAALRLEARRGEEDTPSNAGLLCRATPAPPCGPSVPRGKCGALRGDTKTRVGCLGCPCRKPWSAGRSALCLMASRCLPTAAASERGSPVSVVSGKKCQGITQNHYPR